MNKFDSLSERALDLSDRALELAGKVGDNFQQAMPSAGQWLQTGVKLGALKSGARVAASVVRRNPAIVIATAAGAGLLWYAARRKARQAENGSIEGESQRVDARRANGGAARRKPARSTRTTSKAPSASAE
ncbi:hypothetical protein [Lysobacter sp. D1-1-M9]|uniref:hypothetical protein n=1 Tax=Novilysobacter longmucuonensis TaxID=3098603 RepID=UPI002FCB495D